MKRVQRDGKSISLCIRVRLTMGVTTPALDNAVFVRCACMVATSLDCTSIAARAPNLMTIVIYTNVAHILLGCKDTLSDEHAR